MKKVKEVRSPLQLQQMRLQGQEDLFENLSREKVKGLKVCSEDGELVCGVLSVSGVLQR